MEVKPKQCKGNYLVDKFEGCGIESLNLKYGLCPSCLYEWMTTTEKGKIHYAKQFIPKVKKVNEREQKIKDRQMKDKVTNYRAKLQTKLQEICRLIDIGLPCLARGYHAGQLHGGHVYAKGGNSTIALNLHNIHRQSAQSNKWQNDDGLLREGLAKEYGVSYLRFIGKLRRTPSLNYSNIEYQEFYKKACKIALDLKRNGETFNLSERIGTRNFINIELKIYHSEYCVYNNQIVTT